MEDISNPAEGMVQTLTNMIYNLNLSVKKAVWASVIGMMILLTGCQGKQEKLPNIIFILADDLGYGDVEVYNPESKIPTPYLNKLAEEGITFTNAHAPAAVCTPTRYSILTGKYPWRSRLKQGVLWVWDKPLISEREFTLPKMLRERGYHTALIGKWHLGWNWPTIDGKPASLENEGRNVDFKKKVTGGPLATGFHYYYGDDVPGFPPHTFMENERAAIFPEDWYEGPPGISGPGAPGWTYEALLPAITQKAIAYIKDQVRNNEEQPFFLFFSMTAPHTPIAPVEEFAGKSEAGQYGDFVYQVDHSAGQVMKALEELDIDKNTLVLFSSDNGAIPIDGTNYAGSFGSIYDYGHYPNANLRGVKSDAWEGGHRVPLILRWPDKIETGSVSGDLVSLTDLLATFGAITGAVIPVDEGVDSYNLLPFPRPGNKSPARKNLVTQSGNGILSYHKGDWKLIMSSGSGGSWLKPKGELPYKEINDSDKRWKNIQLYHLEKDIEEKNNLAEEYPEQVSELVNELAEIISSGRTRAGPALENAGPGLWKQVEWIEEIRNR